MQKDKNSILSIFTAVKQQFYKIIKGNMHDTQNYKNR